MPAATTARPERPWRRSHTDAGQRREPGGSSRYERGTGTPEHLEAYRAGTSAMIVLLRPVEDVDVFEPAPEGQWGDFVIQTDQAHTLEAIECREYLAKQVR